MTSDRGRSERGDVLGNALARALTGATLGDRWIVEGLLGVGGMGVVLGATDGPDGAPVVAKVIAPQLAPAQWAAFVKASRREALALRRLSERRPPSPYIVRFFDEGETDVTLSEEIRGAAGLFGADEKLPVRYLILEYVDGGPHGTTLHERIHASLRQTGKGFPPARARRILRHIARALQDIHAERLIHRDLKPTNVLVAGPPGEEVAKVTDFGIVRVQDDPGTGVVAISVGYSAPEQYVPGNTQVGPQSDIFSFGALTFEVLTGCALFPQDSNTSLTAAQRSHRHSLLDAPTIDPSYAHAVTPVQAIDKLIAHATASSMDSRPSDVRELWRALDAQLAMIERVVAPTSEVQVGTSSTRSRMSSATMPAVRAEIIAGVAPPTAASQAGEGEGPWRWRLRGRDEGVDTVTDAALGEDGRALAVGAGGVRFWDGGAWLEIPLPDGISRDTFRAVARLDPDRYVMGGRDGVIAFLARGEWQVLRGNDKTIRYTALWGSEQGTLVAAGERPGRSAVVWCARDGVWLQAKKLIGVERVLGLATLGPDLVLAAGVAPSTNEPVTTDGNQGPGSGVKMRGTLHVVSTRTGNVEDITPEGAEIPALRAVAASRFGEMVAVGVDGFAARVTAPSEQRAILRRERVETERDLLGVRFDPMSQVWAVAAGRILVRAIGSDGRPVWRRVWWGAGEGPSLFRVYAAADRIVAFSREGLVIEGRSSVRATRSERPPKA